MAPLRTIRLARLELQAAFLGPKCADFICQELRIKVLEVHAWTDSITAAVWHWLQKPAHSWTTWVANRRHFKPLEHDLEALPRVYKSSRFAQSRWQDVFDGAMATGAKVDRREK